MIAVAILIAQAVAEPGVPDFLEPPAGMARPSAALVPATHVAFAMVAYPAFQSAESVVVLDDRHTVVVRRRERRQRREDPPGEVESTTATITGDTFKLLDRLWTAALPEARPFPEPPFLCGDGEMFLFIRSEASGITTNCDLPPRMQALADVGRALIELARTPQDEAGFAEVRVRALAAEALKKF